MMASANSVVGHNEFDNSASIMGGSVGMGGMATEMGAPSLTASINIRCNYGSQCIVVDDQQKFPTFIHFMKCHRCKERNFHHPCQSEGTFLDKIVELELNYDDNRFLCGTCLFIEFPALNSKPSSRESGHGNTQEVDNTQESIEMQDEETAFLQSDLFRYNFLLEGEDEDDTSVESELAPACAWLNCESASAKNTFHNWLKKASSAGKGTKNLHPYAYLLTMAIGMDATEYDKQRVDTYTEKGWIKKMESKVTTDFLKMEVNRRYDLQTAIKDSEGGGSDSASEDESMTILKSKKKSKKPGTLKLKNNELQSILEGNKEFGGRVLNLYEADKVFIRSWITRFLDQRQADCKAEMEEKARAGDHLQAKTLLKMRAIEACLLDKLRPKLIKICDSWGRGKLDQRNSVDKEWDIFDDAAAKYNQRTWNPMSSKAGIHRAFSNSIELSLHPNAVLLTADGMEKMFKELQALLKKAMASWARSGNGKDNRNEEGTVIDLIRIDRATYSDQNPTDKDGGALTIKFVSDDRFQFCDGNLALAYFWHSVDMLCLLGFATQNLGSIGLSGGRARNALDASVANVSIEGQIGAQLLQPWGLLES